MRFISRFHQDRSGSTAIEYALIAALIAVAIFAAIKVTGESAQAQLIGVEKSLNEKSPPIMGAAGGGSGGASGGGGSSGGESSGGGSGSSNGGGAGGGSGAPSGHDAGDQGGTGSETPAPGSGGGAGGASSGGAGGGSGGGSDGGAPGDSGTPAGDQNAGAPAPQDDIPPECIKKNGTIKNNKKCKAYQN